MKKISYKYLKKLNLCEGCLDWYLKNFGEAEYTISQLINKIGTDNIKISAKDIKWLVYRCKFARTPKMLQLFIHSKPTAWEISWIMVNYEFTRTPEVLNLFMASKPAVADITHVIEYCKFARTSEMIKLFKNSNPSRWDAAWISYWVPELATQLDIFIKSRFKS